MSSRSNKGIGLKAKEKRAKACGRAQDTSLPDTRSQRRDDGSGQAAMRAVASNHADVDWPTYPLQTPSGGGPRADPGQKQDPGERILKIDRGIDKPRPVTEARMSEAKCGGGTDR